MSQVCFAVIPLVNNIFDFKLGHVTFNSVIANNQAQNLSKKFTDTVYSVWQLTPKVGHKEIIMQCINGEVLPTHEWY